MCQVLRKCEVKKASGSKTLRGKYHLKERGVDDKRILK